MDSKLSRRRFLGLMGATAAFSAACSRAGRDKIVPYTKRPAGTVPGSADKFASVFPEAGRAHPVLVVTREGRPIHVEGNDLHPDSRGKAPLRAIADILGLYDPDRLRQPLVDGRRSGWDKALGALRPALDAARKTRKPVLLMTGATTSATRRALITELGADIPLRWVRWEPASGPQACLQLERAKVMVCFEADILSGEVPSWVADFAKNRRGKDISRLYAFEGGFSLTRSKADHRLRLKPSRAAAAALALVRALTDHNPSGLDGFANENGLNAGVLRGLAADLARHRGAAVAVCGPALPPEAREAVSQLSALLGAKGRLIEECHEHSGLGAVKEALEDASKGKFSAAIFWGANPAYSFPDAALWKRALAGLPVKASIGLHVDETALDCGVVFPENHWLESWGDHESDSGLLSLQQPAIGPLYDTLQGEDVLLRLTPAPRKEYRLYLEDRWRKKVYSADAGSFERFWTACLHDGFLRGKVRTAAALKRGPNSAKISAAPRLDGFELILSPSVMVFDGRYAGNGWLQETPDPLTKQTWGNALLISSADAGRLGLREGQVVKVDVGGRTAEIPVLVSEGQLPGVLCARLGYGRRTGNVARGVGSNLYPLVDCGSAHPFLLTGVRLTPTGSHVDLALTQSHHRMEGRDIARSIPVSEAARGRDLKLIPTMYPDQKFPLHKWGMAVDLSMCTGCSACVVACQSENNIPCVGPEQVRKGREMHWIRVDRYLLGEAEDIRAVSQPMLCQHCDDAPCETVCPVNATTHSPEGLNQMTYNRCVGTRYCGNNCPYKVRRFNFFEYNDKEEPETLVHNPEVTVRPRGVMEKCTFCVQRISDVKQIAKSQGRAVRDGEVMPACATACPAGAIVFGDLKDPASRVNAWSDDPRGYKVLEEVGARPAVTYLAELTNPLESEVRRG
ncbi:MAG: 4Fe-4S dicluster domain-containing protein [Elusimicrobiota bacterium]